MIEVLEKILKIVRNVVKIPKIRLKINKVAVILGTKNPATRKNREESHPEIFSDIHLF